MSCARPILLFINIALSGVFFGLLQWGAFFLLQSYLASTALVWLLATSVWLLGSLAGLVLPGRRNDEPWWLLAAAIAYYSLLSTVTGNPYDLGRLPWLLACVAGMGLYAGRFFRYRRRALGNAKWLLFVENTGFVLGLLLTMLGLYWFGQMPLILAPGICAVLCLVTIPPPEVMDWGA